MYPHHLNRHLVNLAANWSNKDGPIKTWTVEELERRTLLSASPFSLSNDSHFVPTSTDINDVKAGPLAAAGQHLADLYSEYKTYVKKGGKKSAFATKDEPLLEYKGTSVVVSVRTLGSMQTTTNFLHSIGAELIDRDSTYHAIDAYVPISQLSTLTANVNVVSVNPAFAPQTHQEGIANNQGDIAENTDSARTSFGVDGTGVKVGVISDSVNDFQGGLADSVATHDLPKGVQIIEDASDLFKVGTDSAGETDEGRAMLEEIHDIAPGATLAFATSGSTDETLARNIVELARAGCKVIVDDVGFPDEPDFQNGIIGQAIEGVVENDGVVYLSAAGNGGNSGFGTNDAHWVTTPSHQTLLDWDPSSNVNTRMQITVNDPGEPITMEWAEPYNGVAGNVSVDLDIQFFDPKNGELLQQATTNNLETQTPLEVINPLFVGTYDVQVSVADKLPGAVLPSVVRFTTTNGAPDITGIQYPQINTTAVGHGAGQDVISVGAVPFYLTPPYNDTEEVASESFSSLGPVQYFFKTNGQALAKPLTLLKPDVSGTDAVNNTFLGDDIKQDADKLPNFSGTSAAAPNVAAVVALMLQLDPTATPTDITNALIASAKENPVNGQLKGSFDPQAGFGLVDGLLALHQLEPNVPVPDIGRVVPDTVATGVKSLTVTFTGPVTGLTLSDFTLTRGKDSVDNLMPTDATLTTKDNTTFIIAGLAGATERRGTYTITLAPGVVTGSDGTPSLGGSESFVVSGKPTDVTAIPVDQGQIEVSWTDNTYNESDFKITRADDASFTENVHNFFVDANVTSYKDSTVAAGQPYYYKVTAVENDGGGSTVSDTVGLFSLVPNETVVDNRSAGASFKGDWSLLPDTSDSFGGDYISDGNTGKGTKSATFTPNIAAAGNYYVYVYSDSGKSHSISVPVTINSAKGSKVFQINEKSNSGFVLLGQFPFVVGKKGSVTISNAGTTGIVTADAVRFQATGVLVTPKSSSAISIFGTNPIDQKDQDSVLSVVD